MSGIKPMELTWFYRRLHARGETAETLAAKIASGRTHVTEVLNGSTDSPRTRQRLARLLRPAERRLLGWDRNGNLPAEQSGPRVALGRGGIPLPGDIEQGCEAPDVPRETKSEGRLLVTAEGAH